VQNKYQIGLRIADITVLLNLPYPKERFVIRKDFQPFFVDSLLLKNPDVKIEVFYNQRVALPRGKKIIVEAEDWLRLYSTPEREKFFFKVGIFERNTCIRGIFKRKFEYKKIPFNLEILLNLERKNLEIPEASLPLPQRTAVFSEDFKQGQIYIDDDQKRLRLPFPLEVPLLEILIINFLVFSRSGIIFHGSGIIDKESACLFIGESGQGKTTMAKLWDKAGGMVLHDEKIIVKKEKDHFYAFSMPGHESNIKSTFSGAKISKIFFIYHSRSNQAKKIASTEAARSLLKNGSGSLFFLSGDSLDGYIQFCKQLADRISCYSLGFVPNGEIIDFIRGIK